jgi:hypothetical protein
MGTKELIAKKNQITTMITTKVQVVNEESNVIIVGSLAT